MLHDTLTDAFNEQSRGRYLNSIKAVDKLDTTQMVC